MIHDINRVPELPCADDTFDTVICTASVDYMTRPFAVFREVARILKPGGIFLVIFSNRFFPPKVVKVWRDATEEERVMLVEDFFKRTQTFEEPAVFTSRGKPRPKSDKYAHLGIPSDPVYAVYAAKIGGAAGHQGMVEEPSTQFADDGADIENKKRSIKESLTCPYCGIRLKKWRVPQTPFTEWPNEFQYICFNDECEYYIRGWESMASQGNPGSYRLMYNPMTDSCHPIPVFNHLTLRDGIEDDE
jgi:SAM-dependent methyltransferase